MSRLRLSFAVCEYDHLRDVISGQVQPEGIDLNPLLFQSPSRIFHRATNFGDFDVCELSFGRQVGLVSQGANEMVAIPVFPSRVGRISGFYVRADGDVSEPRDLVGKRVGVPEWTMTATVFGRGWLAEHVGVDLRSIDWVQAGSDVPGRTEPVELKLPDGIRLTRAPDRALTEMLLAGDIDCLLSAQAPRPFREGDTRIKRLVPDYRKAEQDYFQATGIYPIMHLIAIRKSIYEAHPWVAVSLFEALQTAKTNALQRFPRVNHSLYPLPWVQDYLRDLQAMFGEDIWPYGLEPNRPTIEAFLRFAYDQGVCHRPVTTEELFVPQTLNLASA